jgi:hypothetical protein
MPTQNCAAERSLSREARKACSNASVPALAPRYFFSNAQACWRYQSVKREPAPQTWIDPDTGLTCHDILGGFGSECSNF